jgi:phosphoenolpyruvate carboxylase
MPPESTVSANPLPTPVEASADDRATLARIAASGLGGRRDAPVDAPALAADLAHHLESFAAGTATDPTANPVALLALEIQRRLDSGTLNHDGLEHLIQFLSAEGFTARARRLTGYLEESQPEANQARLESLIDGLTLDSHGSRLSFEAFRPLVEREVFGIVMTAHPTFNLSGDAMDILTMLATGHDANGRVLSASAREELIQRMAARPHVPEEMSLAREHELSMLAISHVQSALRVLYGIVLKVTRRHYPDRWTELTPRLITVASWVGYDLDGRSDILWSDTLHKRLIVQQRQLRYYLAAIDTVRAGARGQDDLLHTLELLKSRLALDLNQVVDEIAAFASNEATQDAGHVQRIARRMHDGLALRLVDVGQAVDLVDRAVRLCRRGDSNVDAVAVSPVGDALIETVEKLAVLRAELANYGLGMAHTHVRINSTQLHNAIRKTVGLENSPDDPRFRQSYLNLVIDLLDKVKPVSVNFGSIMAEQTSAKRLFMVVAQMLKYSDSTTPIRFLIAESESAFTVLTALYFARLLGIEDRLDISPLFETEKALEVGSRVIEQLLDVPHYRDYVRRRGRLCIQTGYSDAGRYLGQTPASASIERLRFRVMRLFTRAELTGVQLVIFDTHGESIGRGGHPGSLSQRLAYVSPPATLDFARAIDLSFKQEVSFQGGDGFLYFVTATGALAVVTRILEYMLAKERPSAAQDAYYTEGDYIREFFTTVKAFQVGLVENPDYGALLGAFGTNLLYPSGSRAIKRQHDAPANEPQRVMASQFRAIPHNAILQQLGLPVNSVGGIGEAIDRDPDRFTQLVLSSLRFSELMGIVEYGVAIACPEALRAYVDALDPTFWLDQAAREPDRIRADEARQVATALENVPTHARLIRIYRTVARDFDILQQNLRRSGVQPTAPTGVRQAIQIIHAVRLALVHRIFRLATHVPPFSSQHSFTREALVQRLLHLDVPWSMDQLARIFPATGNAAPTGDFGEKASYVSDESQDYSQEHERIFRPMTRLYQQILRSGSALTQRIGFFG